MYIHFCVIILGLYSFSVDAFFLFADASLIFWDDFEPIDDEPEIILPYQYFCKPKPKPTTAKPTTTMATTTEEPTWICMVCMKKSRHHKNHIIQDEHEGTTETGFIDSGFTWPNPSSIGNFQVPNAFVNDVITEDDQQEENTILENHIKIKTNLDHHKNHMKIRLLYHYYHLS
ncbi:hypothetical protein RR48_04847 [Papilio machaon]|uniref:Uncharacterized protein n=1 Tax=Papilio machaon TaxID=76193 RepID=A0A0N1IPQ2_PAPMA|nr:hypothetical protein RR48_04847 [Papilio machaon]